MFGNITKVQVTYVWTTLCAAVPMLNSVVVSLSIDLSFCLFVYLSFCIFVIPPQCKMVFGFVGDDLLGWLVLNGL